LANIRAEYLAVLSREDRKSMACAKPKAKKPAKKKK
jgi:hypothetical protein